jgi:hypothetical protein
LGANENPVIKAAIGPSGPFEVITIMSAAFAAIDNPNGAGTILIFSLPNGRQYQIPLDPKGREAVHRATAGVPVYGQGDMPKDVL